MDIPSLSMALSQNRILTDVGVAMLSKNLDTMEAAGQNMIAGIESVSETSVNPNIGSNIDISLSIPIMTTLMEMLLKLI